MSASPPSPKKPFVDRRAPPGSVSPLRRLKGLFVRPMALERRDGQLHLTLAERRKRPRHPDAEPTLAQLRAELRLRLLAHENAMADKLMRHLVYVHDTLGTKGWKGLETLPAALLGKALVQAEILRGAEASAALDLLVERLRPMKVAADHREEEKARRVAESIDSRPEVSEATQEEFDLMERSWVGTLPGALRVEPGT